MVLPILGRALVTDCRHVGRRIGDLFAVNTVGTVLAALVTGVVVVPAVGTLRTLVLGMGANVLCALILTWGLRQPLWPRMGVGAVAVGVYLGVCLAAPDLVRSVFLTSEFRHHSPQEFLSFAEYRGYYEARTNIVTFREGATCTVAVVEARNGSRALYINGKADASTGVDGDLITQTLLGLLPHFLAPGQTRALVIGMGTGATAHAAALPPCVRQVDVVEISRDVIDVLPHFAAAHKGIEANPKVRTYVEDARTFLLLAREPYGVIISEPSNPWIAGIGNLFSVEYYRRVAACLHDDGVFLQWLQAYETSDAIILSVLTSLKTVFAWVDVWYSAENDLLITCRKTASPVLDLEAGRALFAQVREHIRESRIEDADDILLRHLAGNAVVEAFLQRCAAVENSDEFPFIEYEAPRQLFIQQRAELPQLLDQRLRPRHSSAYPFFAALAAKQPSDYFAHFQRFHVRTPFTARFKVLKVMYDGAYRLESPWCRKYLLSDLPRIYDESKSRSTKLRFLTMLYAEYEALTNCFVPVPFVPFLREKTAQYLREFPDDPEAARIRDALDRAAPATTSVPSPSPAENAGSVPRARG
jgi:spermidine synthase